MWRTDLVNVFFDLQLLARWFLRTLAFRIL
ncbi:hypothetical protein NC653_036772 [Populus alba x Populus x berolinensis]|uniref:Uncharacterized protein n=1 Tax=Populus alba x Populus x berolinensis TaxID=444605 RepID=A0AAD6PWU9_9ROSI|nr:hypothetical protein NC653_036772 [Populus alba x Populus x berolinensis]